MNKYIGKLTLSTVGLLIFLIFNSTVSAQKQTAIDGKTWQLTAIDGSAINSDQATLAFDFGKKSVSGSGGCNGFGGTLAARSGKIIKISEIISTKMFCENGSDVENKYLAKLEQVNRYKISKGRLQLLNGKKIVLEFAPKK